LLRSPGVPTSYHNWSALLKKAGRFALTVSIGIPVGKAAALLSKYATCATLQISTSAIRRASG
jgi:hypothetical protein